MLDVDFVSEVLSLAVLGGCVLTNRVDDRAYAVSFGYLEEIRRYIHIFQPHQAGYVNIKVKLSSAAQL